MSVEDFGKALSRAFGEVSEAEFRAEMFGAPAGGNTAASLARRLVGEGLSEADAERVEAKVRGGESMREALFYAYLGSREARWDPDQVATAVEVAGGSADLTDALDLVEQIIEAKVSRGSSRDMAKVYAKSAAAAARESVLRRAAPPSEVVESLRRTLAGVREGKIQ